MRAMRAMRAMKCAVVAMGLVACSKGKAVEFRDAPPKLDDAADEIDASTAYRHTIQIDGLDDFLSTEQFTTTSAGYDARVTWDDANIYVGYSGADLDPAAADSGTKWLFVYVDSDPAGGSAVNETYNTQGATFSAAFRADWYVRWRADAMLLSMKKYDGAAWVDDATVPPAARGGSFVEIAVPRAAIGAAGDGNEVRLVTWMINEKANAEGSYAGLYADNFVDGYHANLALTRYLKIDFATARDPNDPANRGP